MRKVSFEPLLRSSVLAGLFVVLLFGAARTASEGETQGTTQASMRGIFNALTTAYQYSLDADAFADPKNNEEIRTALRALAGNAASLEDHGGGLDVSFDYMRHSLANDAQVAAQRFEQGNYIGSRFVLGMITENCVTCHTKLPAAQEFDFGAKFVEKVDLAKLSPVARVNLEITTRQFNAALDSWEEVFATPKITPETLDLYGAFESYLRVCIGAKNDTERPVRTFEKFNQRDDMPASQTELVTVWINSLKKLDLQEVEGKELDSARMLIGDARGEKKYTRDRRHLVEYVAAASLLHRYLGSEPAEDVKVAEALYLLAICESKVSRSYWVSETEFLLARAIRRAPKSAVAREAYAFLEGYTLSAQRATTARPAPEDVTANLEELRDLIEN